MPVVRTELWKHFFFRVIVRTCSGPGMVRPGSGHAPAQHGSAGGWPPVWAGPVLSGPGVFLRVLFDCTQTKQNGEQMLRKWGYWLKLAGRMCGWAQGSAGNHSESNIVSLSLSVLLWDLPGSDSPRVGGCVSALFFSHCTNLGYFLKQMAEDGHLLAPNFTKSSVQANSPAGPLRDNSKVRARNLIS